MKKKFAITAIVIMCIVFIVGLALIFSATSIGENAENSYRVSQGSFLEPV